MARSSHADGGVRPRRRHSLARIFTGVLDADPARIESAALELGRTRRLFAPIAFVAGTLGLVVVGVKPLVKNWRLTLVEFVPAAWIWVSLWNLKSHVLDQRGVHVVHDVWYVPVAIVFVAVAILAFWCNAIFVFAIGGSPPLLRPAVPKAREHLRTILFWGVLIGGLHAFVSLVVSGWSKLAYDVSLSAVVGLMMVTFVTVPASMAGISKHRSKPRDRVARAAVGGTIAAVASTPGFLLDRIGLLMIGTKSLRIPGFCVLSIGVALQVAATSSTKAVKLSTHMVSASDETDDVAPRAPETDVQTESGDRAARAVTPSRDEGAG